MLQNKILAELIKEIALRAVRAEKPVQIETGMVKDCNLRTFTIGGLELDDYFVKNIEGLRLKDGEQFYFIRQQGAKCYIAIPSQRGIQEDLDKIKKRLDTIEQSLGIGGDESV